MNDIYASTIDYFIGRRIEDHVNEKIMPWSPGTGYSRLNKAN